MDNTVITFMILLLVTVGLLDKMVTNILDKTINYKMHKNDNEINCLNSFIQSLKDYSMEPCEVNKNLCYLNFAFLQRFYNIPKELLTKPIIDDDCNIVFENVNKIISSLQDKK